MSDFALSGSDPTSVVQESQTQSVHVVDVTLRDGLQIIGQGQHKPVSTEQKLSWIQHLVDCGFRSLEVTSFASPQRLPQFADASHIMAVVTELHPTLDVRGYVPNMMGLSRALEVNVPHAVFFTVCSETYEHKNVGRTRMGSRKEIQDMVQICQDQGVLVSVGVGMAFHCPYEGPIDPNEVRNTLEHFLSIGVRRFTLADSLGIAGPTEVAHVMETVADLIDADDVELGLHLHNSLGIASATLLTALDLGVRIFETTTTGIGGGIVMPGDPGLIPNVSTETALGLFHNLGYTTGIDRKVHAEFASEIRNHFNQLNLIDTQTVVNWQSIESNQNRST